MRTVWTWRQFRSARLWLAGAAPVTLQAQPSDEFAGAEYHLPEAAAQPYFALEFEV